MRVHVPSALRKWTGGLEIVEVPLALDVHATVAEIIETLAREYPGIGDRVLNEQGELRRHVNIFIDGENARFIGGLAAPVGSDSDMWIHPSLSGGAERAPGTRENDRRRAFKNWRSVASVGVRASEIDGELAMALLLKDKVALITGAGSGIGRASAIRFAEEGAKLMIADVRAESASNTAAEIEKLGGVAKSVAVDVRVPAQVERMVNETVKAFGRLDILFNNAGVFVPKTVVDTSEEEWDWVVDVRLKGVFLGCKYAIPQMVKQGGGVIINTASGAGIEGVPNLGAYQAAKGGVVIMSKGIALDFARSNIRCVSICPGVIETPIAENCNTIPAGASPAMWSRTGNMHPLGRNGKPEEVGALAAFLASDQAGFITGVAVPIDGGFNAGAFAPPRQRS